MTVPEAERYVSGLRERFDPSARLVVPALITLLYPFAEPREIALPVLNRFEAAFAKVALSVQPDHAERWPQAVGQFCEFLKCEALPG